MAHGVALYTLCHGRNRIGVGAGLHIFGIGILQVLAGGVSVKTGHFVAVAAYQTVVYCRKSLTVDALCRYVEVDGCREGTLVAGSDGEGIRSGGSGAGSLRHADVGDIDRTHVNVAAALYGKVVAAGGAGQEVAAEFVDARLVGDVGRFDNHCLQGFHFGSRSYKGCQTFHKRGVVGGHLKMVEFAGLEGEGRQYEIVVGGMLCIVAVGGLSAGDGPCGTVVVGVDDVPVAAVALEVAFIGCTGSDADGQCVR